MSQQPSQSETPEQPARTTPRRLGTMIAYGFARGHARTDLAIARRLNASLVEVLPDWRSYPDPVELSAMVTEENLSVWSAHGCWGSQSIKAERVDLGNLEESVRLASFDDLRRCVDWLAAAGGQHLVIHPGGLSAPQDHDQRRHALVEGLQRLADHAIGANVVICVENMPPGVHPGSRMQDLAELVAAIDHPALALTLDTGHAHITSSPALETLAAGDLLKTTHVHDNNAKHDVHLPPGLGTIDWKAWLEALETIHYTGPIMLECIRYLRQEPDSFGPGLFGLLQQLTGQNIG